MMVLIDTCVWSLVLRRVAGNLSPQEKKTVTHLEEAILQGRAQMPGVVRQELLSGVRNRGQFERLLAAMRAFGDVALTAADYEEAAVCDNRCRSAGISGSTTDYLLCSIAMRRKWSILTTDKDFIRYAQQLPIHLLTN